MKKLVTTLSLAGSVFLSLPTQARVACYVGDGNEQCLNLTHKSQLSNSNEYNYRSPYSGRFPSNLVKAQYVPPLYFIDLEAYDRHTILSPYFIMGEFMSPHKGRYGYFSSHTVLMLTQIRAAIEGPLVINSGYRSPGYNAGIPGSATWSRHQYGDAVDISSTRSGISLSKLKTLCRNQGASFTLTYSTHIHCDWRNHPLDPAFYGPIAAPQAEIDVAQALSETVSLRKEIRDGKTIRYWVDHEAHEDHGDLVYDFIWQGETSGELRSIKPFVDFAEDKLPQRLKVVIGESVEAEFDLR